MLIFFVVGIFEVYSNDVQLSLIDHGYYIFAAVALLGLFGYAYEMRFLNVYTWRMLLPVILVWDATLAAFSYAEIHSEISVEDQSLLYRSMAIGFILVIPQYIALYFYGFRSREIWC